MKIVKSREVTINEDGFLKERFGDHFAQISVDMTMKIRLAVKDVARVQMGQVPFEIEELTKKFVAVPQGVDDRDHLFGYENDEGYVQGAVDYDAALQEYIRKYPKQWEAVKLVVSNTRARGRHASAFAIANRPIHEFIPTETINGVKCTSYTATSVEKSGAIKNDFLVVNAYNDISEALKLIQINSPVRIPDEIVLDGVRVPGLRLVPKDGKFYDIWNLPPDLKVFHEIAAARTETVFQCSTPGAQQWLEWFNKPNPKGQPILDSIKEMSNFTALNRPGPLDAIIQTPDGEEANMLQEYCRRAQGLKPAKTPRIFSEMLDETRGILIYQESVEKIYKEITGCTGPEAEKFRSNVAKKKKTEVEKAYPVFMKAATEKYGEEEAKQCWDSIQTFSRYGFNKSHSVSYMHTAYACAYLKYHFPLEWWAAVLTNATKDEVNETFWEFCGHLVDLPDIRHSKDTYFVHNNRIVAPVSLMNGIGEGAHKQLCKYLPYNSLEDFVKKIQLHKEAGATTKETIKKKINKKTGEETNVLEKKIRLGHSSLNRGVVYTMIISGAMDALFEPGLSTLEKLHEYEALTSTISQKPVEKVPEDYKNITDLQRYQLKKSILPSYGAPLLPLLKGKFGIQELASGWNYTDEKGRTFRILTNQAIRSIENRTFIERPIFGVIPAFVVKTRTFNYDGGKKTGCSITFDLDGKRYELVKWPDKLGKLPDYFNSTIEDSVVLIYCKKYKVERPFVIEDIKIISPAVKITRKEKDSE